MVRTQSSRLQLVSTKEMNTASSQDQYYVYAHCNVVYDEDFVFLFTALFHWVIK